MTMSRRRRRKGEPEPGLEAGGGSLCVSPSPRPAFTAALQATIPRSHHPRSVRHPPAFQIRPSFPLRWGACNRGGSAVLPSAG
ncbi:hypothetical protein U9M48_041736 [Paspalum notatum var. saurae]|uniref:Uncharacterized protein n=1 Tax=Paspalum notatum var. saurae TaxID=547442 RepID=A0AAQ3XDP4_PASNO